MDSGKAEALVLNEIEKEGGALAMKNLRGIPEFKKDPGLLESTLASMRKRGKLFTHKHGDLYTHQPMKKAWEVIKMAQIRMTPEQYIEHGERHRVTGLEPILAADPARNIAGAQDAGRGHELSDHTSLGYYNQYVPMETDVPLQADTLERARDAGYTIVTEGSGPGGRTYNFRTKSSEIPWGSRPEASTEVYPFVDYDQRSRQPLPPEGQEAARIAIDGRIPGQFYGNYVPTPPHIPPTREQLGRILQDHEPEDIDRIMNLFGEENKTARAIGAMRGVEGGKYGSRFARKQSEKLIEDWLEKNVYGPRREAARVSRQASRGIRDERSAIMDALEGDFPNIYEQYKDLPIGRYDKFGLRGTPEIQDLPDLKDFRDKKRFAAQLRSLNRHVMNPVEREQARIDRGDTPEDEDAFQQWQRGQRIAETMARRKRDPSREAYLKRKAKREAKQEELQRLRELREERNRPVKVVGSKPKKKRRLGTFRGGRR